MFDRGACLALLLSTASLASGSDLAAVDMVRLAFEREDTQDALRTQYIFREHAERWGVGRDGKRGKLTFTRDFENIYLEGELFRKLVAKNGRSLKGKEAAEEDRRMQMTAAERRAHSAVTSRKQKVFSPCEGSRAEILRMSEHVLLRQESPAGHPVWVVQSTPRSGLSSPSEQKAAAYKHIYWIDSEEHAITQEYCEVINAGVDTLPGSWIRRENSRTNESLWLIHALETESFTADGAHWFQTHRFFDFRRFGAETTVTFDGVGTVSQN